MTIFEEIEILKQKHEKAKQESEKEFYKDLIELLVNKLVGM